MNYIIESEDGSEGCFKFTIGFENEYFTIATLDKQTLKADNFSLNLRETLKLYNHLKETLEFYKVIGE